MRQFAELAGDVRDLYPMLAGIRADSPGLQVHFGPRSGRGYRLDPKAPRVPSVFSVTSHEPAHQVLTDNVQFSSAGYATTIGQVMGRTSFRWIRRSICATAPWSLKPSAPASWTSGATRSSRQKRAACCGLVVP